MEQNLGREMSWGDQGGTKSTQVINQFRDKFRDRIQTIAKNSILVE